MYDAVAVAHIFGSDRTELNFFSPASSVYDKLRVGGEGILFTLFDYFTIQDLIIHVLLPYFTLNSFLSLAPLGMKSKSELQSGCSAMISMQYAITPTTTESMVATTVLPVFATSE